MKSSKHALERAGSGGSKAYKDAGVNLSAGDAFSSLAGTICRNSWKNNSNVEIRDWSQGHFRGPRGFRFIGLPETAIQTGAADGIGTKTILSDSACLQRWSAYDLMAMTAEDIVRFGGYPLVMYNVLDVKSLGEVEGEKFKAHAELLQGLQKVAKEQEIVLMGGETAELGACVTSENLNATTQYNWASFMVGAMCPSKMIVGSGLRPGQRIVALKDGIRSNGLSMVRKYLRLQYGENWWLTTDPHARAMIEDAARPSAQYSKFLATVNGWKNYPSFEPEYKMYSIAHLTGGGLKTKFAEDILFPRGLSADLSSLWSPSNVMDACYHRISMTSLEAYSTFNGGQGALVVLDENDVAGFISMAARFNIQAKDAGVIRSSPKSGPLLRVLSKFSNRWFFVKP